MYLFVKVVYDKKLSRGFFISASTSSFSKFRLLHIGSIPLLQLFDNEFNMLEDLFCVLNLLFFYVHLSFLFSYMHYFFLSFKLLVVLVKLVLEIFVFFVFIFIFYYRFLNSIFTDLYYTIPFNLYIQFYVNYNNIYLV